MSDMSESSAASSEMDHVSREMSLEPPSQSASPPVPRLLTFRVRSKIYSSESTYIPHSPQVDATTQILQTSRPSSSLITPGTNSTTSALLMTPNLATSFHTSFSHDIFYFPTPSAFEVFFNTHTNPLEFPNPLTTPSLRFLLQNIQNLALGGSIITPVMIETLICFEKLETLKLDGRFIVCESTRRQREVETDFSTWMRNEFTTRGASLPHIEWAWDLGYWFRRRAQEVELCTGYDWNMTAERVLEEDGGVFERGIGKNPKMTGFMAQCLREGERRFESRRWSMHDRVEWRRTRKSVN